MCEFNPYNDSRRIDPCMKRLIPLMNLYLKKGYKTVACCCGHEKYPKTLLVECNGVVIDWFSGKIIPRKKKFYKKDSEGFYYIPETLLNGGPNK